MAGAGNGPIPHMVGPCPTDNAPPAMLGVWEEITPPTGKADPFGSQGIVLNPQKFSTLYVGSNKLGIFKSEDCGSTWVKADTGLNAATIDSGLSWSMAIDPTNPNVIYSVNGYGNGLGLWKTVNGGVDWVQLFPAESEVAKAVQYNFTSIVSMDPDDHNHLVVSFHADCLGAWAPGCQAETKDGGANWRLVKSPSGAGWEGAGPIVLNATSWLYAIPGGGLWLTTDNGATWKNVTPAGAMGAHYQMYHAKNGTFFLGSLQGMLKSSDGKTWELIPNSGTSLAGLVGDGTKVYVSQQFGGAYFSASEADPTTWTKFVAPSRTVRDFGGFWLAYDPDHHVLYSSNQDGGLWRLITR